MWNLTAALKGGEPESEAKLFQLDDFVPGAFADGWFVASYDKVSSFG